MATFRDRIEALLKKSPHNRQPLRTVGLTVRADIVELNGDPITSEQPPPTLHRSASGHLFLPNYPARSCEKCKPRPRSHSLTALDSLRLSLRGGTNLFFYDSEDIVKINDGPAKQPNVVWESTWGVKAPSVDETHTCCGALSLRRKGCFSVRRKSQEGILERGDDEGE